MAYQHASRGQYLLARAAGVAYARGIRVASYLWVPPIPSARDSITPVIIIVNPFVSPVVKVDRFAAYREIEGTKAARKRMKEAPSSRHFASRLFRSA